MDWNTFVREVVNNEDCILIMDDTQEAYSSSAFWTLFKAEANVPLCMLLAFSTFDVEKGYPLGDMKSKTPIVFTNKVGFPYVAFSQADFNELAEGFKQAHPKRITDQAIGVVAQLVSSTHNDIDADFYLEGLDKATRVALVSKNKM